jgi:hypothetical protein
MANAEVPIACSLDSDQIVTRGLSWKSLATRALGPAYPADGGWSLEFDRRDLDVGALAQLVGAEVDCCPFFTFGLVVTTDRVTLTVSAPPEAAELAASLLGA